MSKVERLRNMVTSLGTSTSINRVLCSSHRTCFSAPTYFDISEQRPKKGGNNKMDIEAYVYALRVINPRNKSGIVRLVGDMLKEHPKTDIEAFLHKVYPQDRERRR